ncbi:MAG: hypothetical protein LC798_13605 [Chloroflexi bacterium]|nr:hypothetical protein [Chloroflexota bacterium]
MPEVRGIVTARKRPKPRYYTTDVPALRSMMEIGELVARYGARSFGWRTDPETGEARSVYFVCSVDGVGEVPVEIEAKPDAIEKRLYPKGTGGTTPAKRRERSLKVAWRQVHQYVELMLEMVENGLKPFHEAFMSDVVVMDGAVQRRLGDLYVEGRGRLLAAGAAHETEWEVVE